MTADGSPQTVAEYLGALRLHVDRSRVRGGAEDRERFIDELAEHLAERVADAMAAGQSQADAEAHAVAACGNLEVVTRSWIDRCQRQRRATRRRGSALLAMAAMAGVLGISQHADAGRRAPSPAHEAVATNASHAASPTATTCLPLRLAACRGVVWDLDVLRSTSARRQPSR